ncbi:hypothetical protein FHT70_005282 [Rhizobium sp. BK049]|uniref:hypothetical protein n=1 Tax=Rhizobium sp. BK049 TaxID=2587095 RepID=UPI00161CE718|nr:hypothetical protein [Rhizobium sp. BK049]MBB3355321.1 hypothetical protein [Rhizobium sp. BK049]
MMAETEKQIAAWNNFVQAKTKAESSLDFADGKAAALAWREFCRLFVDLPLPVVDPKGAAPASD